MHIKLEIVIGIVAGCSDTYILGDLGRRKLRLLNNCQYYPFMNNQQSSYSREHKCITKI